MMPVVFCDSDHSAPLESCRLLAYFRCEYASAASAELECHKCYVKTLASKKPDEKEWFFGDFSLVVPAPEKQIGIATFCSECGATRDLSEFRVLVYENEAAAVENMHYGIKRVMCAKCATKSVEIGKAVDAEKVAGCYVATVQKPEGEFPEEVVAQKKKDEKDEKRRERERSRSPRRHQKKCAKCKKLLEETDDDDEEEEDSACAKCGKRFCAKCAEDMGAFVIDEIEGLEEIEGDEIADADDRPWMPMDPENDLVCDECADKLERRWKKFAARHAKKKDEAEF